MRKEPGAMTEAEFPSALLRLTRAHGIVLPPEFVDRCLGHVRLMLEWNRRTNLTRITDLEEVLVRHVLDSLIPSPWLPASGRAADVGSGAGFPGAVLALAYPDLDMTLIEASRKKASFLKVLAARLRVGNLSVFHGTWQQWVTATPGEPSVDCITMRAVRLEEEHLAELAARVLRPGGVFSYWAGPGEGSAEGPAEGSLRCSGLRMLEPVAYALPNGMGERRLLRWTRKA
jgi:16S rRNA (guanine527-N7)-methyltransferase